MITINNIKVLNLNIKDSIIIQIYQQYTLYDFKIYANLG